LISNSGAATEGGNTHFVETSHLVLVPHHPADLRALLASTCEYEARTGRRVALAIRDFVLAASPDFMEQLQNANSPDPWRFGFAAFHKIDNIVMGMAGFTAPPDPQGAVEIAYGIDPTYQGKGYATEVAQALVDYAVQIGHASIIRAHSLPETNASTRVLDKCGFKKIGEITDPENNRVWRWEKTVEVQI
jgi:ribosomal-protein-alanine N-acetyltransferase